MRPTEGDLQGSTDVALHDGRPPRPRIGEARARGLERIVELAAHELSVGLVPAEERADVRRGIEYGRDLVYWFRTHDGGEASER